MKKRRGAPRAQVRYLVLWWQAQVPYAAVFDDEVAAHAAANVRNALLVEISGPGVKFEAVVEYYRRVGAGKPMPAEWGGGYRPLAVPWGPRPRPALASGIPPSPPPERARAPAGRCAVPQPH